MYIYIIYVHVHECIYLCMYVKIYAVSILPANCFSLCIFATFYHQRIPPLAFWSLGSTENLSLVKFNASLASRICFFWILSHLDPPFGVPNRWGPLGCHYFSQGPLGFFHNTPLEGAIACFFSWCGIPHSTFFSNLCVWKGRWWRKCFWKQEMDLDEMVHSTKIRCTP